MAVDGKKTCIVCGKKFSTRVRKPDGTWQDMPHKRTCSQTCSDYWHNKMRYQVRREKVTAKVYKTRGVPVKAKCPYCGVLHTVLMAKQPLVMPRLYCKLHLGCREEWEAVGAPRLGFTTARVSRPSC